MIIHYDVDDMKLKDFTVDQVYELDKKLYNISAIYQIINIENNKSYIGQTDALKQKGGIYNRWIIHIQLLNNNKHHNQYLQNSWNKYGAESFRFNIIEITNENLSDREKYWGKYYNALAPNGYSLILGEDRPVFSETTKTKMSQNHADFSGEKSPMYGRTGSKHPCWKRKVSLEERQRRSGKHHTQETKDRISKANSGDKNGMYGRTGSRHPNYRSDVPPGWELYKMKKNGWTIKALSKKYKYDRHLISKRINDFKKEYNL